MKNAIKTHKQKNKSSIKPTKHYTAKKQLRQSRRKVLLKDAITKVVDTVKKSFSHKNGSDECLSSSKDDSNVLLIKNQSDVPFAESSTRTSLSKFFCTNDIDILTYDDWQLYNHIIIKYPGLSGDLTNELVKRNTIIDMLKDDNYMQLILKDYNMTVLDFFKFLFRLCPSIFKGLFVRKILKTLSGKPYAKSIKFGSSTKRRKLLSKKCIAI